MEEHYKPYYNDDGELLYFFNLPCIKSHCIFSKKCTKLNTEEKKMVLLPKELYEYFTIDANEINFSFPICLNHFHAKYRELIASGNLKPEKRHIFGRKKVFDKIVIRKSLLTKEKQSMISALRNGLNFNLDMFAEVDVGQLMNDSLQSDDSTNKPTSIQQQQQNQALEVDNKSLEAVVSHSSSSVEDSDVVSQSTTSVEDCNVAKSSESSSQVSNQLASGNSNVIDDIVNSFNLDFLKQPSTSVGHQILTNQQLSFETLQMQLDSFQEILSDANSSSMSLFGFEDILQLSSVEKFEIAEMKLIFENEFPQSCTKWSDDLKNADLYFFPIHLANCIFLQLKTRWSFPKNCSILIFYSKLSC